MRQVEPSVFVVDDDVSVREALDSLICSAGWRSQVFASAHAFLAQPHAAVPSCLVLDLMLPDLGGLELQHRVATERADMPIIFITGCEDVPLAVRAMKAGAVEFLMKPLDPDAVLRAISHALERSEAVLRHARELQTIHRCYASLSRREREVMSLVAAGLLNKQVGGELGISEITVKAHRGQVMRKMKADSFAMLVSMALGLGIVPDLSVDPMSRAARYQSLGDT